jgi:putative ABC transport system permease protein
MPALSEPAAGLLISVPPRAAPVLNNMHIRSGRLLESRRDREVLVSEAFARAHDLQPGGTVTAILNGRLETLEVVGLALSPEYIYQIREGDLLPDDRRFGVFWMQEPELAAAFDMEGAFNDLALTVTAGASVPEVIRRVDALTEAYGSLGAFDRSDHQSHKFVENEIKELRATAVVVPVIFLSVAAFLLNVVLTRLIAMQREEIAALKAVGYTRLEIGGHYLMMVLVMVGAGVVLGTIVGAWMGAGMTQLYTQFFHFPVFDYYLDASTVCLALAACAGAAVVGTIGAVYRAVRLPPAEAMQPAPPPSFHPTIMERGGLHRVLSPAARMILRQLERRPAKAALSCMGIALAAAILVVGNFMVDAIEYVLELEFRTAQRQDVTVSFNETRPARAIGEIRHLPGVMRAEPFRGVAARLRFGHRERRLGIMGLETDNRLFRLVDLEGNLVAVPPAGMVISEKLAELLHVRVGDAIDVEVLEDFRPRRDVPVVGVIADFAGLSAYMSVDALNGLMRQEDVYSGAFIQCAPHLTEALHHELKAIPAIAGVTLKDATILSFRETLAEMLLMMTTVNVTFAVIIAFGVVYNNARVSLSERTRDLATLRVIGFTRAEISFIQLGELALLTAFGVPAGLALGYLLSTLTAGSLDTELFRIPVVIERSTYGFAAVVVLTAAACSGLVVRRMIDRLDLVSVLKSRD